MRKRSLEQAFQGSCDVTWEQSASDSTSSSPGLGSLLPLRSQPNQTAGGARQTNNTVVKVDEANGAAWNSRIADVGKKL